MKKWTILTIILLLAMIMHVTVYADVEPLETFSNADGTINIIGFTTAEDREGISNFVALLQYENTTEDSDAPMFNYSIKAYQDGIELEHGHIYEYSFEDYKSADTKARPGATLNFYVMFQMESGSPVDLEVSPMFNLDNEHIEHTFDLSEEMIAVPSSATADSEENTSSVAQKIAELEQRVTELENRVTELEG